jgi:hypothetical protein
MQTDVATYLAAFIWHCPYVHMANGFIQLHGTLVLRGFCHHTSPKLTLYVLLYFFFFQC